MTTTLTVNKKNEKGLPVLQEILDQFGLEYAVENEEEYIFSKEEIESLVKDSQDYIEGKTKSRDWDDVRAELKRAIN